MSMLTDLYTAIAAGSVTVEGTAITGTALADLREYQPDAHLPVRLMLPFGRGGVADNLDFVGSLTRGAVGTYRVTDLFLYKAVPEGESLKDAAEVLVTYRDDYAEMVLGLSATLDSCYMVQSLDMQTGVQVWDGVAYFGVEAVLTVSVFMQ
jgi:hypothetical protein